MNETVRTADFGVTKKYCKRNVTYAAEMGVSAQWIRSLGGAARLETLEPHIQRLLVYSGMRRTKKKAGSE